MGQSRHFCSHVQARVQLARSIFHIASRGFYAYQDTKTPFIVSIFAIGTTILLSILFYLFGYGTDGLGWAQSLGAILEIIILLFILNRRSERELLNRDFLRGVSRMLFATLITACVSYSMTKFFPLMATDNSFFATFPKFCLISVVTLISYLLSSYFLGIEEAEPILEKLKKLLFGNLK